MYKRQVVHRAERQRQIVTLSEKEFDDILQRNKSVSSGAIMRAVQDASEGSLMSHTHTHIVQDASEGSLMSNTHTHAYRFLLRCMECSRGIAMGILSVCPSVKRVHCDKTEECYV